MLDDNIAPSFLLPSIDKRRTEGGKNREWRTRQSQNGNRRGMEAEGEVETEDRRKKEMWKNQKEEARKGVGRTEEELDRMSFGGKEGEMEEREEGRKKGTRKGSEAVHSSK